MESITVGIIIILFALIQGQTDCGIDCIDIDPPGGFNCTAQALFGKCEEDWMTTCNCACERCPKNSDIGMSEIQQLQEEDKQEQKCGGNSLKNSEEEHDLHVVIDSQQGQVITDENGNGKQRVTLDGRASHTHQPNESIVYFEWRDENGAIITEGTDAASASAKLDHGEHQWTLKIFDNNQKSLSACYAFIVTPKQTVPGTLTKWYPQSLPLNFNNTLQKPKFAQFNKKLTVEPPYPVTSEVVVEIKAIAEIKLGNYIFEIDGGNEREIFIRDKRYLSDKFYDGQIEISIRVQVRDINDLPINIKMIGAEGEVTQFYHNQENEAPIISSLSEDQGPVMGGNQIKIFGQFIDSESTKIYIGNEVVPIQNIEVVTSQSVVFVLPPGEPGKTTIKLNSNGKFSNELQYKYLNFLIGGKSQGNDWVPSGEKIFEFASISNNPNFTQTKIQLPKKPTSLAWCHGKLYTCSAYHATIQEITFDENYEVVSLKQFNLDLGKKISILGIACNPKEKGPNWKLFFTHTRLYYQSSKLTEFQPYFGRVSYTTAPDFSSYQTIVTGLPTSNYDHGVNQLQFDKFGRIFVSVGGNTNAGVADKKLGNLQESPYSGAIVQFEEAGGNITCQFGPNTPEDVKQNQDPMDARYGQWAQCWGINIYATGFRNAFGLLFGQDGSLIATDNGPNWDYGACLDFECQNGWEIPDRIINITAGAWYGHPNPSRGQNTFIPAYKQGRDGSGRSLIRLKKGGSTGLCEYTSQTFRGQWFGHFFVQRYKATQYRCDPNFESCTSDWDENSRPNSAGTDCVVLPGGVVAIAQFPSATLALNIPQDQDAQAGVPVCFDITPWRGIPGILFHIGCANLQTCTSGVEVYFCLSKAEVTKIGQKWIEGIIPAASENYCEIQIVCGGTQLPKVKSFQYL